MDKVYIDKDVYSALQERLDYLFQEFDNIYVSFSGGKDSGLLYQLVLQYMDQHNIRRPIGLFHQDFEAQYTKTTEFVTRVFDAAPDFVRPYWVCLPMGCKTNLSNYNLYWYPWDPDKHNVWVRPMPNRPEIICLDNTPMDYYKYKMPQEDLAHRFGRWYQKQCGGGKTIGLLGLRATESLHRYSSIINKRNTYQGQPWITVQYKDVYTAAPLYDWETADVWTAIGKFGFDYNQLYDLMYKAGVPLSEMRVASPFNEWAAQSLNLYRILEPDTWARLVGRISGANFGAIYGDSKALGYKTTLLPTGHTWKSYALFLLATLPAKVRDQYWDSFRGRLKSQTDSANWAEELDACEDAVSHGGAAHWSPTSTSQEPPAIDMMIWKQLCGCILKNDHRCRNLRMGSAQKQIEQTKAVKRKFTDLIRGKTHG